MNPLFRTEYVILALALFTGACALLAWRTSAKSRGWRRMAITVLRTAGLVCLGLIALNPGRWREERLDQELEWAVLADRSASMNVADVGGKARWLEAVRLAEKAAKTADDKVKLKVYSFAGQLELQSPGALGSLKADGASSDIFQAGKELLARYRTGARRLAGMILVSDGRQVGPTRVSNLAVEARAQEAPIYAMPLGGNVPRKDLAVSAPRKMLVTFVGQKLKLPFAVANEGLGNVAVDVTLSDAAGKDAGKNRVEVAAGASANTQFEIAPADRGYFEYAARIPAWDGDSVEANNIARVGVAVLKNRIRVFVVEGVPGWDSKFLIQLLRKQSNMEVTSVYRLSAERFFMVETDPSKTSETSEPTFPDTPEKLGAYDVLVIGKGLEYFMSPERIKLLRDFVEEQGGCLVFARGKPYSGTLLGIEQMEPVSWGDPIGSPFKFGPARAGEYAGLFGEMLPGLDDPVWKKLPDLSVASRCTDLKAFSQVLAEGTMEIGGKESTFPALVCRRAGKGMVLTVNAEGLWQWDFFPSVSDAKQAYREIWAQLLQWVVTYSEFLPGQEYALRMSDAAVYPDTPVSVKVSKRGPVASLEPALKVFEGGTVVHEATAGKLPDAANRWNATFTMAKPGVYRVELADVPSSAGGPCAVFQVNRLPTENDELSADRAFLAGLAEDSGGIVIGEKDLAKLLVPPAQAEATPENARVRWVSLWDRAWYLCLVLLFFGAEWFIRRRSGLI